MAKRDVNDAVERFLNGGGKVTQLRYASEKDTKKSSRNFYHRDKALSGSGNSKALIERGKKKESTLIFSRTDRWTDE